MQDENANDSLAQIRADILKQNICPDLAQEATQLVMGHGNPQASVVFIGEAPGKNEDLKGVPFVGAAGKILDQMLALAGMERGDVYITNIVKYRPPNNRDPKPEEKKAFWPFLVRELAAVNPDVVVTLGRHSMEYFLPDMKIGEVHGKPKKVVLGGREMAVMPLYHPAAAIYNGNLKATLFEDFAKVPSVIENIS